MSEAERDKRCDELGKIAQATIDELKGHLSDTTHVMVALVDMSDAECPMGTLRTSNSAILMVGSMFEALDALRAREANKATVVAFTRPPKGVH